MTEEPMFAQVAAAEGEAASVPHSASLSAFPSISDSGSNEELLERLDAARRARRHYRKFIFAVLFFWLVSPFVLMTLFIFNMLVLKAINPMLAGMLMSSVIAMVGPVLTVLNQWFYQRTAKGWEQALLELANRGEERALGPLLELMDTRANGTATAWGSKRTLLVGALKTLLSRLTPEGFGTLSDKEIASLMPMLSLREPGIKEAVTGMLGRCGDARALRTLREYETRFKLIQMQKWNPMLYLLMASRRFTRTGIIDKETQEFVRVAVADITPRVEEEQRNSQLLRASSASAITSNQLLRAASSDEVVAHSDQLLRPISTETPPIELAPAINSIGSYVKQENDEKIMNRVN